MKYHEVVRPREIEKPIKTTRMADIVDAFDAEFCDVNQEIMFKLLLVTEILSPLVFFFFDSISWVELCPHRRRTTWISNRCCFSCARRLRPCLKVHFLTEELCGFVFVSDLIALEYQGKRRLKYDGHSTLERITHPKRRRKSGMSSRISLDRSIKILVTI